MTRTAFPLALGLLLLAPAAFAEEPAAPQPIGIERCQPPPEPPVPDGNIASADGIRDAARRVRSYVEAGNAYIVCLTELERAWGGDVGAKPRARLVQSHNAMVDQMESVAARFNAELREFKSRKQP